jgi:transposase-like protein
MDKLVKTLGIDSLSKSQVSRMAVEVDEHLEQFRHRPLDAGSWCSACGRRSSITQFCCR